MDRVLSALATAGFNGVRLPMWPGDNDQVRGPDPLNEARDIGREFCDSLNKDWVSRISSAPADSPYFGFTIYVSPAFDNKRFQETLTQEEYVKWVLSYTTSTYSPDFISPFSGNDSTLRHEKISDASQMSDQTTMWEMDTLKLLKESDEW